MGFEVGLPLPGVLELDQIREHHGMIFNDSDDNWEQIHGRIRVAFLGTLDI